MPDDPSFWEDPDTVERFASLEPDRLLTSLLTEWPRHRCFRALDLGCAAGRNTEALVRAGFETLAVDVSPAMTRRTHERLERVCPNAPTRSIVLRARFDRLPLPGDCVDLVVAVGIYIQANSDQELRAGLAETYRVLSPRGKVFVSMWSAADLPARARCVAAQRFVYAPQPGETKCRLSSHELVEVMAEVGLLPDRPLIERRSVHDGRPRFAVAGVFEKGAP
jgi:SAM-dependent methyltransferase